MILTIPSDPKNKPQAIKMELSSGGGSERNSKELPTMIEVGVQRNFGPRDKRH